MRSQLQKLGDPRSIEAHLRATFDGPPRATVREFATKLGNLALHYWRPDFTPEHSKLLYGDFVRLLAALTADELQAACDEWVMDPLNRFYPTPGQLYELAKDRITDRARQKAGAEYLLPLMPDGTGENPGMKPFDPRAELAALAEKLRAR